jgi:predicted TIM-barrel fold metal-dependent hydrolase
LHNVVDVHSHPILPIGKGLPVGHPGNMPEWSIDRALSHMEAHDIAACLLSIPDAANHAAGQDGRDIARRINEALADIVSRHPDRFGALATIPGLDADAAPAEIEYALDSLKLDGVASAASIDDDYLGERHFDP